LIAVVMVMPGGIVSVLPLFPAEGARAEDRFRTKGGSLMVCADRRLTKHFGGLVAVSDMSFEIAEGEIVGLIAPTGRARRPSSTSSPVSSPRPGPHFSRRA